jgi:hypothetical protein
MVIKVSTLLTHNTSLLVDTNPTLGGPLNTNNFSIENGSSPVTISGNEYPITTGAAGQVLTTNGFGTLYWSTVSGTGTVTSVGLTSSGTSITISGSSSPITGAGTFNIDLPLSGVTASTYGSASTVGVISLNTHGIATGATNTPISITPLQAGLSNVINSLQVINSGGAPSIREGSGIPLGIAEFGAIYIDQTGANGKTIYFYNGTSWTPISDILKLYSENSVIGYISPSASGSNSIALGSGSSASQYGSLSHASGNFVNVGDAQSGQYILRNITTDTTPTELFLDGSSTEFILPINSVVTFSILISARRTDTTGFGAGFKVEGVAYRDTTTASVELIEITSTTILGRTIENLTASVTANTATGGLKILVTGAVASTYRWVAVLNTSEVTF